VRRKVKAAKKAVGGTVAAGLAARKGSAGRKRKKK